MQWISYKEKMPDPYVKIIVTDGKSVESTTYIGGFGVPMAYLEKINVDEITHWAICPELPNND